MIVNPRTPYIHLGKKYVPKPNTHQGWACSLRPQNPDLLSFLPLPSLGLKFPQVLWVVQHLPNNPLFLRVVRATFSSLYTDNSNGNTHFHIWGHRQSEQFYELAKVIQLVDCRSKYRILVQCFSALLNYMQKFSVRRFISEFQKYLNWSGMCSLRQCSHLIPLPSYLAALGGA